MFTKAQLDRMANSPVRCPYCNHVSPNHIAYISHQSQEHEPATHGKKSAKRERERYARQQRG